MKWMEFQCEAPFVAESPLGYQHLFQVVCGCPKGLLNTQTFGKLFFNSLRTADLAGQCDCATEGPGRRVWNAPSSALAMVTVLLLFRLCRHGSYVDADGVHSQAGRLALLFFANSFESPVLRRSVSDEWREIHFAGDQIRSVKFSFERQGSRVTPHIAD